MNDFRKKCDEWLNPLGYTVHYLTESTIGYSNTDRDFMPGITCHKDDTATISGGDLRLWLSISSMPIVIGHSDIVRWVETSRHYIMLCESNPAF